MLAQYSFYYDILETSRETRVVTASSKEVLHDDGDDDDDSSSRDSDFGEAPTSALDFFGQVDGAA
jgi:hypothetical protein